MLIPLLMVISLHLEFVEILKVFIPYFSDHPASSKKLFYSHGTFSIAFRLMNITS